MKYKSRIGAWFVLVLLLVAALALIGALCYAAMGELILLFVLIFALLDLVLLLPILFLTDYTLCEQHLRVRCAYLVGERIPYRCIKRFRAVRDYTFGPALSFDRLEITYRISGQSGRLLLSPKDRDAFISALCSRISCPFESLAEAMKADREKSDEKRS